MSIYTVYANGTQLYVGTLADCRAVAANYDAKFANTTIYHNGLRIDLQPATITYFDRV